MDRCLTIPSLNQLLDAGAQASPTYLTLNNFLCTELFLSTGINGTLKMPEIVFFQKEQKEIVTKGYCYDS